MNSKAKQFFFFLITILVSIVNSQCSQAQNDSSDNQAVNMIRDFYQSYVSKVYIEPSSKASAKSEDSILTYYCTKEFKHKLKKIEKDLDGDPFVQGQDADAGMLKTMLIKKDLKSVDTYIVSWPEPERGTVTIHLQVVKQGNEFKISNVKW